MSNLVVATGPITRACHEMLSPMGDVIELDDDSETRLQELAPQSRAFVVRGGSRLSRTVIELASGLEVIGRSGIGTDGVDLEAATERGIPVVVTPTAGTGAVAEGVFALILAITKRLNQLDTAVRNGMWGERDRISLGDLEGATLGVVGMGRIGRRVSAIAQGFQMDVLAYDPFIEPPQSTDLEIRLCPLEELFASADFITLHAPLTNQTKGIIDLPLLKTCKSGAILVNLARGGLIDSYDSLLQALDGGHIAGIGLDVFEEEPPDTSHSLFRDNRIIFSPHALGLSELAKVRIFREMAEGMIAAMQGQRPKFVANPEIYKE